MPFDLAHVDWGRRTEPAELPEWMDEPCSAEDLGVCLRDLGAVNRLTRGYHPTLQFLDRLVTRLGRGRRLRILDVGSGSGDGLDRIARWSRRQGVAVELAGIDLNPDAAYTARERYRNGGTQWITGDVLQYAGAADVVVSSLLTHHLSTPDVVRFLQWMEANAAHAWFVNDLERSRRSAVLFALLSRVMRWHRFVVHDGPVSFARSFTQADWLSMLQAAGLPAGAAVVGQRFPARLCVSRFK